MDPTTFNHHDKGNRWERKLDVGGGGGGGMKGVVLHFHNLLKFKFNANVGRNRLRKGPPDVLKP